MVKMLVATTHTQGLRDDDFSWTFDGELVWPGMVCHRDRANPGSGGCGCGRSFSGLSSHRATTTAEVVELPLDEVEVRTALWGYLQSAGYICSHHEIDPWLEPELFPEELALGFGELLSLADTLPVGTVLEREGRLLRSRLPV